MKALRITRANRDEVAAAVGGRAWADGVIVALPGGGEKHLRVGEYALVPTTPPEKETPMDSHVTVRLTASQAAVIAEAVAAHRRTMLWTMDSLHAAADEKGAARDATADCNRLLTIFAAL